MTNNKASTIDEYIAMFPPAIQELLQTMRTAIHKAAPKAEETISYQIPTFTLHGNLVHFAAFKHHIGFYPGADGIASFSEELSAYKGAKGSVQFPLDKPLPIALVTKIVKFRVQKNLEKAEAKKKSSPKPAHKSAKTSATNTAFASLSAPARRALEHKGINTVKLLSKYSEAEILQLHGIGPSSIPKLRAVLQQAGLHFRK